MTFLYLATGGKNLGLIDCNQLGHRPSVSKEQYKGLSSEETIGNLELVSRR